MNAVTNRRVSEIVKWAADNNNRISRRMVYDIIREKNTDISDSEIEEAIYDLEQRAVFITDTDDEDYFGYGKSDAPSYPADVNITMRNLSLELIIKRLEYDEIDLNPDFQRMPNLWSVEQKSRLIESLMLKIPVPSLYFDGSDDSKWIVIDGLQRLSALKGFVVDKEYTLKGLEYLSELEGMNYDSLPRIYVRRLLETQLAIYTVEKGTPRRVISNIFKRLNTGGLVLTSQEIRHALNQGRVVTLIKNMAACDEFKKATDYAIKPSRLRDCEYATRFLAFTKMGVSEYQGNIDDYLDAAMEMGNRMSEDDSNEVYKSYKRTLQYCVDVFGRNCFRKINSEGRRGPVNKALFEAFTLAFSKRGDSELSILVCQRKKVLAEYKVFLSRIDAYLGSGDKYSVSRRMQLVDDFVGELINAE